jgi:hypothetical protein
MLQWVATKRRDVHLVTRWERVALLLVLFAASVVAGMHAMGLFIGLSLAASTCGDTPGVPDS